MLDLVDAPKPKIIKEDVVIVNVTDITVCGSYMHLYNGKSKTA